MQKKFDKINNEIMTDELLKDFTLLRARALTYLKDFLTKNQVVLIIPESKIGEIVQIASNIIINKNKIYADRIEPEWRIGVNDLSFDEIYHILSFLKREAKGE